MKKVLKQIQAWKREMGTRWRKLTAFQRIVLGVSICILMVWGVRTQVLDRIQSERNKLTEKLTKDGVPFTVPPVESDNEAQESQQLIENLEKTLIETQKQERDLVETKGLLPSSRKNEALLLVTKLVSQSGLSVVEITQDAPPSSTSLPVSEHRFVLTGNFQNVYDFFRRMKTQRYPCRLYQAALTAEDEEGEEASAFHSGPSPVLSLTFRLRLYYHDGLSDKR